MKIELIRTASVAILLGIIIAMAILLFALLSTRSYWRANIESLQDRLDQCQLKVWEYENAEDENSTSACLRLKDEATFYRDAYYNLKDQDGYRLWSIAEERVRKWEWCFPDEFCHTCLVQTGGDVELCYDLSSKARTGFP